MNNKTLLYAAGVAGVVTGLLSGIPIISLLNCLFCGWLWVGGAASVYLYNGREGGSLTPTNGALVGAATGVVAALVGTLLASVFGGLSMAALSQLDPEMQQYIPDIATSLLSGAFSLVFNFICYAIFGALGGLIGASIFKKK